MPVAIDNMYGEYYSSLYEFCEANLTCDVGYEKSGHNWEDE